MFKKIIFILILLLVLTGCKRDDETKPITNDKERNSSVDKSKTVNQDKKEVPVVEFRNVVVDQKNLTFSFVIRDDDLLIKTLDIIIYNMKTNRSVIEFPDESYYYRSIEYSNWTYDNLDPYTNYCIRAVGSTQNKSDYIFGEECFKTEMYTYVFETSYKTTKLEDKITYNFSTQEKGNLNLINEYKLSVYVEDELHQQITFLNLSSPVTIRELKQGIIYKVVLTAHYGMNPDPVILLDLIEYIPVPITIESITANRAQLGESFYLNIKVNNTSKSTIRSVRINGQEYTNFYYKDDVIQIKLVHDSEDTIYTVKNIEVFNYGLYNYTYTEQNTFQMKTLGEFNVYSSYVNEQTSMIKPTDDSSLIINILNKTGYLVTSITTDKMVYESHEFSQTENEIVIPFEKLDKIGHQYIILNALTLNDGENDIQIFVNEYIHYYYLNDSDIKKVSTPEELMNIHGEIGNYGFYELINDIDMTGYNFTPIEDFNGCISGNGFTISNLTIDTSNNEETTGMFNNFHGFFENINLSNVTVISNRYAAIIAKHNTGYIRNVTVDGNLYVGKNAYAGGISVFNNNIIQNVNSNITIHIPETYETFTLGGITTYNRNHSKLYSIDHSSAIINILTGNLRGTIGGIVGEKTDSSISRSTVNFNISLNNQIDNIFIYAFSKGKAPNSKIRYSTVNGNINITPMDKVTLSQVTESELAELGRGNVSNLLQE